MAANIPAGCSVSLMPCDSPHGAGIPDEMPLLDPTMSHGTAKACLLAFARADNVPTDLLKRLECKRLTIYRVTYDRCQHGELILQILVLPW